MPDFREASEYGVERLLDNIYLMCRTNYAQDKGAPTIEDLEHHYVGTFQEPMRSELKKMMFEIYDEEARRQERWGEFRIKIERARKALSAAT